MTDVYERAKADDEKWEAEHGADSREKLEADIKRHFHGWVNHGAKTRQDVFGWLDRQAAITEREYRENYTGMGLLHDLNENGISVKYLPSERRFVFDDHALVEYQAKVDNLQAKVDELQAALNTAEADNEFLRDELGSEPFCSQVKRWLNGDAPHECLECDEGCYRELLAKECDTCQPMVDAEAELAELRSKYDALRERRGKSLPDGYEWPRFNDGKPLEIGDRYVFEGCAVREVRRIVFDHTEKGLYGDGKPYMEIDTEHETRVYPMGYEFKRAERTVEDVLREFGWECANNCGADPDDVVKYADEIRRLS